MHTGRMNQSAEQPPENNPLLAAIDVYLAQSLAASPLGGTLKEGDLLVWLRGQGWIDGGLADTALYQVHFLMRNALYRLLPDYPAFEWHLDALGVRWQAAHGVSGLGVVEVTSDGALADYYLDWSNFNLTDASVQQLLDSFWRRYAGYSVESEIAPALAVLGLAALPEDLDVLKHHYRRRVASVHPDRAGASADTAEAQRLNVAYATIKRVLKVKAL